MGRPLAIADRDANLMCEAAAWFRRNDGWKTRDDGRPREVLLFAVRLIDVLRSLPIEPRARHLVRVWHRRLRRWSGFPVALPGSPPDSFRPARGGPGTTDFVFFGVVDWHFRFQRPQQLAVHLVRRGHRVLYVSSNFLDAPGDGFRVEKLDEVHPLYQVYFALRGAPGIYWQVADTPMVEQLRRGLSGTLGWSGWREPVFVLGHPFWSALIADVDCAALVYDRMDFHEGFGSFSDRLRETEQGLMRRADLTVCSSRWLEQDASRFAREAVLIRNATDFDHFSAPPQECYRDPQGRRVIGYYGSIAPWLDLDIVAGIAERFRECAIILIGRDQIGAARRLSRHPNVKVLNEVPYAKLPGYLHGFDVCILPRPVNPLTRAMNPVKLYEYLSAGRPVVATNLPEIQEMSELPGLVYSGNDRETFLDAVAAALAEAPDDPRVEARRRFAASQTWPLRAEQLERQVRRLVAAGSVGGIRERPD